MESRQGYARVISDRRVHFIHLALSSPLDDAYRGGIRSLHVSGPNVGLQQEIKVVGAEQPLVQLTRQLRWLIGGRDDYICQGEIGILCNCLRQPLGPERVDNFQATAGLYPSVRCEISTFADCSQRRTKKIHIVALA